MVVDDHPIVRQGLAFMVLDEPDMEVVADAATVAEALARYEQHRPDVCLVDLRLPDGSGVDLIQALRARHPRGHFVVLTTFDGDDQIHRAIAAGARGYALKDMPRETIIAMIRAAAAGRSLIPEEVAERLAARVARADLTDRELDVLRGIARGRGNKQIAADLAISEGTVRAHMVSLFRKLGVNDRTSAVVTAVKRGLVQI
jgi:two-component system NarL family response regulator